MVSKRTSSLENIAAGISESERVRDFQDAVRRIGEIGLQDIEVISEYERTADPEPVDTAKNRFRAYGTIGMLYLEQEYLSRSIEGTSHLAFEPLVSRGGKRSAHGVFFGNLNIIEEDILPVAIKPHSGDDAQESCLNEYFNNAMVEHLGFPNLESVGFIISESDHAYSLTLRDDTLTTLDSIDWSKYYPFAAGEEEQQEKQEIWRQISQQVAGLHNHGNRSHGDLAARNIAVTISGGVFIIDWERARLRMDPPRDAEVRYDNSYTDLSELMDSICLPPNYDAAMRYNFKAGLGMFYGKDVDWWEGFKNVFYNEYKETRLALAAIGGHHKQSEADIREELNELEKSLRSNMEMQRDICESFLF